MAPEILMEEKYGRRVDVWSLGCTVFEMATGKHPWSNCKSLQQLIINLGQKRTLDVEQLDIDRNIKEFITYCCVFDRMQRPTADEVLRHPFLN